MGSGIFLGCCHRTERVLSDDEQIARVVTEILRDYPKTK